MNNILCQSNSDARRLIIQGVKENKWKKVSINYLVTKKDLLKNNTIQLSIGKKNTL